MNIVLLKRHNGAAADSLHDVSPEAANYLVRCGVAEYAGKQVIDVNPVIVNTDKVAKPKAEKQIKVVKPNFETK